MTDERFTSYSEIADFLERELPAAIRHERRRRGLSLRQAADETGVSFATMSRWEHGEAPVGVVIQVLRWLSGGAGGPS